MKKIMMMAAVAAAVLTSCSNSELIELSDSRAIGFETYVGKASTRGVPVTGNQFADGQSIKVWGFYTDSQMTGTTYDATATGIPNLEGAVITKTGGNWTYSPQAYWKNGKAHTFFASAPGEATATLASGVFSYTVQDEVANQVDFMVADALKNDKWDEASTPDPAKQVFAFRHALSQIKYSVGLTEVAEADASDVKVKSIKVEALAAGNDEAIAGFYTTGDIDIVGRAADAGVLVWTNLSGENKTGYMVMPDAEVALGDAVATSIADYKLVPDATDGVLMLLPQKTVGNVRFTVTLSYTALKETGTPTKEVSVLINTTAAQTWEVNKIYHYKLGISMPQALKQKAIEFDDNNMIIEPWDATVNDTELAGNTPEP
jgi:hypothetical protein